VSGQMSLFEVALDKRVKVINVEGLKNIPVKRWEVVNSMLRVFTEYGLEDYYEFTVVAELEMSASSATVDIPSFNCLTSKDISRDKGYLAVEARANVEVAEKKCEGIATLDVSEIPESLFQMASNPLLLAYKFITPGFTLSLDVKKHAEVGVLIAVVDAAYFSAIFSPEGYILYRLLLKVRNTQQQYVRISVARGHEIWSTTVQGKAVKPAQDDKGLVMIPLEKQSSKAARDTSANCEVEFIYTVKNDALTNRGNVVADVPFCDIPINQLFVEVWLPNEYKYGEFTGMREVGGWSKEPGYSAFGTSNATNRRGKQKGRYENQVNTKLQTESTAQKELGHGRWKGVLPVRVETLPKSGKRFVFEQLLVSQKPLKIEAPYKKIEKGSCSKKRVGGCCC